MSLLIYLDQNILSDLRKRKIEEKDSDEFKLLRLVMRLEQIILVYSHVTLEEISQIGSIEYRQEHIEVLMELNAQYIEPLTGRLNDRCPSDIWREYIENNEMNVEMGINTLLTVHQLISRKISGLPVVESFHELNNKLKDALNNVIVNAEAKLSLIDNSLRMGEERRFFIDMKSQFNEMRENIKDLNSFLITGEQILGPQPFRDMPELNSLEIEKIDVNYVVNTIESIFKKENSSYITEQYVEMGFQSDVARAYSLMNWAGYYADDFTKIKKGRDRFNASSKDMMHVIAALRANFLISNDMKFRKKAMACYAYIGVGTVVCSPKEFLGKHCKFE